MSEENAALLTPAHNYAVVQLPGRKHPGVVVQGDSLLTICESMDLIAQLAQGTAAEGEAAALADDLRDVLRSYLLVLQARGIEPPFSSRPPDPTGT